MRLIKDATAAGASDWIRFVQALGLRSALAIAHIRHAVRGAISFENTQPFVRELGGRAHVFAHNGALDAAGLAKLPTGAFRPMGESDPELAFCHLLARLDPLWRKADEPSPRPPGLHLLERFCSPAAAAFDGAGIQLAAEDERRHVTLLASVPLSEEPWEEIAQGALVVAVSGRVVARIGP